MLLSSITACSPNPDLQGNGEVYLQGEWQQLPLSNEKQLIEYTTYRYKFSCDSFYMQIETHSKVNNGVDNCTNADHWVEYTKGTYIQRNDTLNLKGQFCNADYSIKQAGGCFRAGVYTETYKMSKKTDSLIVFASTASVIPITARLNKRYTCKPKPL